MTDPCSPCPSLRAFVPMCLRAFDGTAFANWQLTTGIYMAKDLALVLNSGSLNSAVITALAAQRFRTIMVFADIAPGSARHRAAYDQQIAHFKPYREHTLAMPYLSLLATPADTQ